MHNIRISILFTLLPAIFFLPLLSCHQGEPADGRPRFTSNSASNPFADYWYQGEAELCTYEIEQSRYGETRKGQSVLVFVTEDFSKKKQVKLDNPTEAGNDKVSVLKLNRIRRFVTGIYDYSMMQSVFTPVDTDNHPHSLKTTTTSQDWCGHTFTQFNLDGNQYRVSGFSYFESEGDVEKKLTATLLEDEIWTKLRINPKSIPQGSIDVIPSTFFARLNHRDMKPEQARIRFDKQGAETTLTLEYLQLNRTVAITFESAFPHKLLSWNIQQNGRAASRGKLTKDMKAAYWQLHDNRHTYLRDSLGVVGFERQAK